MLKERLLRHLCSLPSFNTWSREGIWTSRGLKAFPTRHFIARYVYQMLALIVKCYHRCDMQFLDRGSIQLKSLSFSHDCFHRHIEFNKTHHIV